MLDYSTFCQIFLIGLYTSLSAQEEVSQETFLNRTNNLKIYAGVLVKNDHVTELSSRDQFFVSGGKTSKFRNAARGIKRSKLSTPPPESVFSDEIKRKNYRNLAKKKRTKNFVGGIMRTEYRALKYFYGEKAPENGVTPCTFPTPDQEKEWKKCGEPVLSTKFNICDPEAVMSFTQIDYITKPLDLIEEHYGDHCICSKSSTSGSRNCWYKFAFAFLKDLPFPRIPLPSNIGPEVLCQDVNLTSINFSENSDEYSKTTKFEYTLEETIDYGNQFADILRKRWKLGSCDEDILILVVERAPKSMATSRFDRNSSKPAIFVSMGHLVKFRSDHVTRPHNYEVKSMEESVTVVNQILRGNSENAALEKALALLISYFDQVLQLADQTFQRYSPNAVHHNHAPPTWALCAFAGCGALLVIMALGSCLVRTRVRRSFFRNKQAADANRHWKAGFVGGMLAPKYQDHLGLSDNQRSRSFLDVERGALPRLSFVSSD
uniref:Uncharacterized protein n=1 Tax=Romanomermis culicivorax TaxID=13658 RepID=A0A915JNY7_ROMCU